MNTESPPQPDAQRPQPLVSIVAPCYNGGKYLEEAIRSFFSQDYPNSEVIVVDDGSTGNSPSLLRELQQTYDFQFYTQANQGVSAALNHGLAHAKGVYVSTPDLDDVMLPHSVRVRAEYLEQHPEVGCVGALITYIDEEGEVVKEQQRSQIKVHRFDDILRKAAVVQDKKEAWRLLRSIPWRHLNKTSFKRLKRLVLRRPFARPRP